MAPLYLSPGGMIPVVRSRQPVVSTADLLMWRLGGNCLLFSSRTLREGKLAALQDEEVGDGTITVVIIAAELLKNAVKQKIHPTLHHCWL